MTDLPESIPIGGLDLYLSAKPGAQAMLEDFEPDEQD